MVVEVFAGIGAFKTMFDLAKGLKDIDDRTTRNAVAIELQEKILAAQAQQAALIEQVGLLEKEVAGLKAWGADKQRYELKALRAGAIAYMLKPQEAEREPPHALCANCYERGIKSFLQSNGAQRWTDHSFDCPVCKVRVMARKSDLAPNQDVD